MNKGKSVCNVLKGVRKAIADANGIKYEPAECGFEGECRGTCPACEAEVRYIERELKLQRLTGRAVTVAGIALGAVSLSPAAAMLWSIWGRSRLRSRQKVQTKCSEWLRNSRAFPAPVGLDEVY